MKHTSGPWKIDTEDARVISTLDGDMVAVCEYISEGDGDLISAAPEMLEALGGAKWLIDSFVFNPAYYEEYQDVCNAIKKARGEG